LAAVWRQPFARKKQQPDPTNAGTAFVLAQPPKAAAQAAAFALGAALKAISEAKTAAMCRPDQAVGNAR
jgi:hypothetical protein